ESSINEVWFADKPIELEILANPGIYNNMDSKYWVLNGRLAPEFSCPVTAVWKKSRNNKLHTFAVTGFRYI
ncbi:MAG TPA: ExsB family protein, partial [Petrotogaceae bacterium]|nr:ExsB family protein [Petrotogaceae bacterium]